MDSNSIGSIGSVGSVKQRLNNAGSSSSLQTRATATATAGQLSGSTSVTSRGQVATMKTTTVSTVTNSCSSSIDIPSVIAYVKDQMDRYYYTYNQSTGAGQQQDEIPQRLQLKNSMLMTNFYDALLIPISIETTEMQQKSPQKQQQVDSTNNERKVCTTCNDTGSNTRGTIDNIQSKEQEEEMIKQNSGNFFIHIKEDGYIRGRHVLQTIHNSNKNINNNNWTTTNNKRQQSTENTDSFGIIGIGNEPNNIDPTPVLGSICIVIRRPGCSFCQKQVLELSLLATLFPHAVQGFTNFWCIIKDTDDEEGIVQLQSKYLYDILNITVPIYCDKSYMFYNALGNRKITLNQFLFSPNTLLRGVICEVWQQWKDSTTTTIKTNTKKKQQLQQNKEQTDSFTTDTNTETSTTTTNITKKKTGKGEGLTQGGIIVFDSITDQPLFAYEEDAGTDLPIAEFVHALDIIRQRKRKQHHHQQKQQEATNNINDCR